MNEYVFTPAHQTTVPVVGSNKLFPVRRIYCVGRNYAAHIKEMGGDERQAPIFFQKPTDSIVMSHSNVPYPTLTNDLHHEIELVMAIGKGGSNISADNAVLHVFGLATGIDLTRRDLQTQARKAGGPWEIAKAFDHSAPLSAIQPLHGSKLPSAGAIKLSVNGATKQSADLAEMIWTCAEIVSVLSTHNRLEAGDLIFTGTPSGVGPVVPGDQVIGTIDNLPEVSIKIS